jgi:hypothetical protein
MILTIQIFHINNHKDKVLQNKWQIRFKICKLYHISKITNVNKMEDKKMKKWQMKLLPALEEWSLGNRRKE